MQCDFQNDSNSYTIRFRSQPKLAFADVFWSALFVLAVGFYTVRGQSAVPLIYFVVVAVIFVSVGVHRMFSTSSLIVEVDSLSLDRRLFGIGFRRKFSKGDVEFLGYQMETHGYRSHTDSALVIMVREDIMPVRFAQTIAPTDAQSVFDKLKQSGSWLGEFIRPIGTPVI